VAEEPERRPARNNEAYFVDGGAVTEALAEPHGLDRRRVVILIGMC
jgi:hypothetical protein